MLAKPDLLLLDEPTNHLDAESVNWLEHYLRDYDGAVVLVTHDRYFLDNVAGWILELDRGHGIPWEGNYSSWLEQKRERLEREEKSSLARQKTLQRELEWVRLAPRARQAKGKARLNAYEALRAEEEARLPETVEIAMHREGSANTMAVSSAILDELATSTDEPRLLTRLSDEQHAAVSIEHRGRLDDDRFSRTAFLNGTLPARSGDIVIVAAGTSDAAVAA